MKIKANKRLLSLLMAGAVSLVNPINVFANDNSDTIELLDSMVNSESDDSFDLELYKKPVIRATTEVNIRECPNTDCNVIGSLSENETIRFAGVLDGWYEVYYDGKLAYVNANYVKNDFDYVLPDEYQKLVYMNTDTTIYQSNNYDNPITTLLTYECAEVYSETNGFYLARTNDVVGFVPIEATTSLGDKAVVVDISSQKVSLYYDNKRQLYADVVTGNPSTPTYIGLYYIHYKQRDTSLTGPGYSRPVKYWMPFNGNIGLHDADWRYGVFGGNIYRGNGSHGCVNMDEKNAEIIFNSVESGTPVVVKQ